MYAKFRTNLIGLAVALGFVVAGFGLGEPPMSAGQTHVPAPLLSQVDTGPQPADDGMAEASADSRPNRQGALKRHLAMPYVSFAAFLPRQEP